MTAPVAAISGVESINVPLVACTVVTPALGVDQVPSPSKYSPAVPPIGTKPTLVPPLYE